MTATTAPAVPPQKLVSPPSPSPGQLARALGVVSGGPLLLDALEILGPLSALGRWPQHLPPGLGRRLAWILTAKGVAALAVDHGVVRPWLRRLGSTPGERARRMPGDTDAPVLFTTTRAVPVDAPAEEVWRWLVQIGQDRGGFYSYDWLENLAGCELRSADAIHEEWQHPGPGDELVLFPGFATQVLEVDPPRALVIENWGAYVVEPVEEHKCRLVARSRAERNLGGLAYVLLIELPHAIMERKMLLGIKERAEASPSAASSAT